jgi:hypothetical protein
MKLQYIKPCLTTVEVEMHERLLFGSPLDGSSLGDVSDGTGDETGTMEKFINPIWGDDPSADEGDALSPW